MYMYLSKGNERPDLKNSSSNSSNDKDLGTGNGGNDNDNLGQPLIPSVAVAATILRTPGDASNSQNIIQDDKKSVGVGQNKEVHTNADKNESSDYDDENHGQQC